MHYLSHHRLASTTPHYGMRPSANHRDAGTPSRFAVELHRARFARPESRRHPPRPPQRASTGLSPNGAVWPAALAIMLVANLATPAGGAIPRHTSDPADGDEAGGGGADTFGNAPVPSADVPAPSALSDVVAEPVVHQVIKSDYTFHDFLRAVSAARAPFHYLGESVRDVYETLSGQEVNPDVRSRVQKGADALDLATGVLPQVRLLRLPGQLAGIVSDDLEGKATNPEELSEFLQFADPRNLGAAPHMEDARPSLARSPSASRPVAQSLPGHGVHEARPEPNVQRISPIGEIDEPHEAREPHGPHEPDEPDERSEREKSEALGPANSGGASRLALASPRGQAIDPVLAAQPNIIGEAEHLQGYEQQLPEDQLPAGEPSRIVVVNGHHYLKGEAGYYRAERGISADHWLIDAPHGSERRAQVPVTYDERTGEWHAHAPLRLCGGGCGSSRMGYAPDSIAGSYEDIRAAVRHVPDEFAQEAIQLAFSELSALHLRRTNRADLQSIRDNSIVHHRTALREAMSKHIDPRASLIKQQRIASEITAMYYVWNEAEEAFCQENAEILFYALLQNGISRDHLRMITIKPQNRPPHVLVLYTESENLINLMDLSTPQPPLPMHQDGIGHEFFREAVYLTRHSTVLLDPWSRTKAISFATATDRVDAGRMINRALNDIGYMPGSSYTVSVTRPLGMHQASPGGSSGQSASSASSRGGSLSSADTLPSHTSGDTSSS